MMAFNVPLLMVFEKRPSLLKLMSKGLRAYFPDGKSGRVYVMPLYGVTLQAPGMPQDAFAAAQKWSRILPVLPDRLTRTAKIDYENDRLLFQDKFYWDNGKPAKTYLPVPPTLQLARRGGMKISVSRPVTDTELATMAGPLSSVVPRPQIFSPLTPPLDKSEFITPPKGKLLIFLLA